MAKITGGAILVRSLLDQGREPYVHPVRQPDIADLRRHHRHRAPANRRSARGRRREHGGCLGQSYRPTRRLSGRWGPGPYERDHRHSDCPSGRQPDHLAQRCERGVLARYGSHAGVGAGTVGAAGHEVGGRGQRYPQDTVDGRRGLPGRYYRPAWAGPPEFAERPDGVVGG